MPVDLKKLCGPSGIPRDLMSPAVQALEDALIEQERSSKLDDRTLIRSLKSSRCPACGGLKKKARTFCHRQFMKLPRTMKLALYDRLGEGYCEAVQQALEFLGVTEFHAATDEDLR